MNEKLQAALDARDTLRDQLHANCMVVWHELQSTEPELAEEILALGLDEATAAEWFCRLGSDGETHELRVAQGRSADVRAAIRRAAHSIFA